MTKNCLLIGGNHLFTRPRAWAGIAIDGSERPLWGRERSPGSDIKRYRNTRQLTRQCHRTRPFVGRLPYQARRDRIALSCELQRRHRHFHGRLAPGGSAYSPIPIQFGDEPVFECRGRPLVFRILEGDCPGPANYRAQFSRAAAEAIVEAISPICRRGNAASRRDNIGARGSPSFALK